MPSLWPNNPTKVDPEECPHEFGEKIKEVYKWRGLSPKLSQTNQMGKSQDLQLDLYEILDRGPLVTIGPMEQSGTGLFWARINTGWATFSFQWWVYKTQSLFLYHVLITVLPALASVAQWIECQPENQRNASSIPSWGTCLGCRPGPQGCTRGNHILMFLSPTFSLPSPLSKITAILFVCTTTGNWLLPTLVYIEYQNKTWMSSLYSMDTRMPRTLKWPIC